MKVGRTVVIRMSKQGDANVARWGFLIGSILFMNLQAGSWIFWGTVSEVFVEKCFQISLWLALFTRGRNVDRELCLHAISIFATSRWSTEDATGRDLEIGHGFGDTAEDDIQ